jgi:hypothetical protein
MGDLGQVPSGAQDRSAQEGALLLLRIVVDEADDLHFAAAGGHEVLGQRGPGPPGSHDEDALQGVAGGAGGAQETLAEHAQCGTSRREEHDRQQPVDEEHASRVGPMSREDAEEAEDDDTRRGAVAHDGQELGYPREGHEAAVGAGEHEDEGLHRDEGEVVQAGRSQAAG